MKKLTQEEIWAMQPESTRKAMGRSDEQRASYWLSNIPSYAKIDEANWNMRKIMPDEYALYKDIQHKRYVDKDSKYPKISSVSLERREKAISAFVYAKSAKEIDPMLLTGLKPISSISPYKEKVKTPFYKKMLNLFIPQDECRSDFWVHVTYANGDTRIEMNPKYRKN